MGRIDQETVQKILDAADIVDVVSDFVKLRRSGANYKGLCPFHDERTPSFSVNKARNICKCFSCGKGGSPVNFIMEHEQLSYQEALRYLARKYNIEIVEHELSDEERRAASDREAMLGINEFALSQFEHNLTETDEGRNIALPYFRHRGISDAMIRRFHLGYSLDKSTALYSAAISKGYQEKYLVETGLCIRSDRGGAYDRFKSRVMFPIHSVSGRVVGFGGRTMRSDKNIAKYVNSPESTIYVKNRELYGLFQAKSSIAKKDKCILVEGYMDVISMHQAGVENVVASSGTSLTQGQIRAIRRFTKNITLIYDADAAGIKASLRGINLLLAEEMSVKVMLLPEGDDPDSFAQSHTSAEVEVYLHDNEQDIIAFMTRILMKDVRENDPVERAKVINTILRSVGMVSDGVTRTMYVAQCARTLGLSEEVIILQLRRIMAARIEEMETEAKRTAARESLAGTGAETDSKQDTAPLSSAGQNGGNPETPAVPDSEPVDNTPLLNLSPNKLKPYERVLACYVARYGLSYLCEIVLPDGSSRPATVVEYILADLGNDDIVISDPVYRRTIDAVEAMRTGSWPDDRRAYEQIAAAERLEEIAAGQEHIRQTARDVAEIESKDAELTIRCDANFNAKMNAFDTEYAQKRLLSDPDNDIRNAATDLVSERYTLSKIHTKFAHVETEQEQLPTLVPRAIYELKSAILSEYIDSLNRKLAATDINDTAAYRAILQEIVDYQAIQKDFAKSMGERIILPRK